MSVSLFKKFVESQALDIELVDSENATRTAEEAAKVHGVPVSNIVKSLVVKAGDEFIVALCPGDKRVDFEVLRKRLNKEVVRMATPDEVKKVTGHSIGGVPPFGHKKLLHTIIIPGFESSEPLWAAAGAADLNFQTTLTELEEIVEQVNSMLG
jgi:prolyl-tRNA editing enzyme YbaK/EbsC (Cys-tRNA(Pro) deacylase)